MQENSVEDLIQRVATVARRTWPDARLGEVHRLEGGVSSLTFASTLLREDGELPIVLKVAPAGLAPVRNRDVLRQARLLDRLDGLIGFPVPAVVFDDGGDPPAVPPLFAMTRCPGEAYEPLLDLSEAPPGPDVVRRRMLVAAEALGRLQAETPHSLGLDDEPVVGVEEELARWHRLFATVDADIAPGHQELHARLAEHPPVGIAPRLLHGDYRLANMLFSGPDLSAVIDWEIWSVGDPRTDLAWLLMHLAPAHVFHAERSAADLAAGDRMPSREEMLEAYAASRIAQGATDEEVESAQQELAWFEAVCHYKVAATVAVIHKRERKRDLPDPKITVAARHLEAVLAAGHEALDN